MFQPVLLRKENEVCSVAIVTRVLARVGLLSLPTGKGGCVSLSSKLAFKNNNF